MLLVCRLVADAGLHASHADPQARAVGFREQTAKRNGVRVRLVHLRAYLLSAVLGGTAMPSGLGSMVAAGGAATFLTQLQQLLVMLGSPTASQFVVQGVVIAADMAVAEGRPRTGHRRIAQ